ncbi:MAG: molybdopterin-binding protein [Gammaproteobacteria bacterium]|nr:molybdopterin-binding protein [Gammaproteobacteria bacterium]
MTTNAKIRPLRPAVVTVGDELVLGEKHNGNQMWLLQTLWKLNQPARVSVSLPDDVDSIARWVAYLVNENYFPILVSGGIGGTHDDCTREGIAKGLDVPITRHDECHRILEDRYGVNFTPQRQRMALLPQGCELIDNAIGAPGFSLRGVYAFPGFPNMLQPMANAVLTRVFPDLSASVWITREAVLATAEGNIAEAVEAFGQTYTQARVGIYPSAERFGRQVTVRIRVPPNSESVLNAFDELVKTLENEIK